MEYSIDNSFGFLLSKIKGRLKNKMASLLKPYGMTPEQRSIVLILCRHGAMTQKSICDLTDTNPANMAITLKRLISSGYIEKVDHPSDSRAYHIKVTKKAQNIEKELISYGVILTEQMFKGVSDDEQDEAKKTLRTIFENLKGVEK
jgi:DNA-binding MarR family transcriptional regulator